MKKTRNDSVKAALVSYLERRNYPDTDVHSKTSLLCQNVEQMALNAIINGEASCSNSILYSSINNDPAQCDQQFSKLVLFIKTVVSEKVQNQLNAILCPLLCHMYLEMLRGGHRSPAQMFLKKHSSNLPQKDYSYTATSMCYNHQTNDGNLPSALYRPNSLEQLFHSLQNGTIDNDIPEKEYVYQILDDVAAIFSLQDIDTKPSVAAFRSCKYEMRLSHDALGCLENYLEKHGHIILLQVFQTWFDFDVISDDAVEQDADRNEEEDVLHNNLFSNFTDSNQESLCNGHMDLSEGGKEIRELQDAIRSVREVTHVLKVYQVSSPDTGLICGTMDKTCRRLYAGFTNSEIRMWGVGRTHHRRQVNSNISKIPLACNVPVDPDERVNYDYLDPSLSIIFRGHSGPIQALGLIENADREGVLISVSHDTTVRAWRLSDYSCAAIYRGHNYPVWCLDVMQNGIHMATGSHDKTAKLWSPDRTFPLRIFSGHLMDINCVQFHPNGSYLSTGGADRTVRLWCCSTGRQVRILPGLRAGPRALAFSPDGKMLASAGEDRRIKIWDLTAGKLLHEYKAHHNTITTLDWTQPLQGSNPAANANSGSPETSLENGLLASGSMDGSIRLWDCLFKKGGSSLDQNYSTFATQCSHFVTTRMLRNCVVAVGAAET